VSARHDLDPRRTALIVQGLQNDVMAPAGKLYNGELQKVVAELNVVANIGRIAAALRQARGVVAHVTYVIYSGGVGVPDTAPVFRRFAASGALLHGSWGAAPWDGLPPEEGDFVIEKLRVNPFHGSTLLPLLRSLDIRTVIPVGTQTNMGVVSAARAAADEGFEVIAVTDASATNEMACHQATFDCALTNVATITDTAAVLEALRLSGPPKSRKR